MDFIAAGALDQLGTVVVLLTVAVAVITDKLVWHTRLRHAQQRADRWERIALDALLSGAQAGVKAAEVTADVVNALPTPAEMADRDTRSG